MALGKLDSVMQKNETGLLSYRAAHKDNLSQRPKAVRLLEKAEGKLRGSCTLVLAILLRA